MIATTKAARFEIEYGNEIEAELGKLEAAIKAHPSIANNFEPRSFLLFQDNPVLQIQHNLIRRHSHCFTEHFFTASRHGEYRPSQGSHLRPPLFWQ